MCTEFLRSVFSRSEFSRSEFSRSVFSRSEFSRSVFSRSEFSRSEFSRHPQICTNSQRAKRSGARLKTDARRGCEARALRGGLSRYTGALRLMKKVIWGKRIPDCFAVYPRVCLVIWSLIFGFLESHAV